MRQEVSDQMTAATGNDPTPLFGILFEGSALKRVNLVADEASNGHGASSSWRANCRALLPFDGSVTVEL
jgi:hypothetical protein